MTKLENTLKRMQTNVEALIRSEIRFDNTPPLYTNNVNRQAMIFYEIFRHTAYAVLADGGGDLAIKMMTQVAKEIRAFTQAFNEESQQPTLGHFRETWTRAQSLEKLGWFMDCEEIGEITFDDECDGTDPFYQPDTPGWVMIGGGQKRDSTHGNSVAKSQRAETKRQVPPPRRPRVQK